uniref:Nematode cuticle collagen N-terminal domain-containing protein n=1 Tax=Caenorhabditis japonica TaxID=281687 RepID=A0A8R1HVD5_CAEJA
MTSSSSSLKCSKWDTIAFALSAACLSAGLVFLVSIATWQQQIARVADEAIVETQQFQPQIRSARIRSGTNPHCARIRNRPNTKCPNRKCYESELVLIVTARINNARISNGTNPKWYESGTPDSEVETADRIWDDLIYVATGETDRHKRHAYLSRPSMLPVTQFGGNGRTVATSRGCNCRGPPGPPGFDGEDGYDGEPGQPGSAGDDDVSVLRHDPGRCAQCPAGPMGPPGPRGDVGPPGRTGAPGIDGVQGRVGTAGYPGEPGLPGPLGEPGTDGTPGRAGNDGVRVRRIPGPPGPPGVEGDAGVPGGQGQPGVAGAPGESGAPGPVGPPGQMGVDGIGGTLGLPGPQGVDGEYCPCPKQIKKSL